MEQEAFRRLLSRYIDNDCTQQERKILEDLVLRNPIVRDWDWNSEEEKILMGIRIKRAVDERRVGKSNPRNQLWWLISIAASFLVAFGAYWFITNRITDTKDASMRISETSEFPNDGVRLALADGRIIRLDSIENGFVQKSDGVEIKKSDDGKLEYACQDKNKREAADGAAPMNTIHVPNGKQIQLTLPDGSVIWINTASKLTYPIDFKGDERLVKLEGEAYFDIAKDKSKPFKVIANGTEIVVTGTHFNVSAYPSDATVTTTLMEGGVVVRKNAEQLTLKPGYEAVVPDSGTIVKRKGNLEQVLAWKNGYFIFDNMDILSVMRSVARWYNVQVEVSSDHANKRFGGSFPITATIDELLKDLETVGKIKFERKGKEVWVMQ